MYLFDPFILPVLNGSRIRGLAAGPNPCRDPVDPMALDMSMVARGTLWSFGKAQHGESAQSSGI